MASLSIFGVTFHLYGLILGAAAVVGIELTQKITDKLLLPRTKFWQLVAVSVLTGIIGARLWHVWTDFSLYQDSLLSSLYIWNGGLSIIGAMVGAVAGLVLWAVFKEKRSVVLFADAAVFGLPLAQAIGRLGNWVNYEVFGYPTTLPWGIFIPVELRPAGFTTAEYFHPLFAYEAIILAATAAVLWYLASTQWAWLRSRLGTGQLAATYLLWYALVRFGLEFLRLEKAPFFETSLSFNQVALSIVGVGCSIYLWQLHKK